MIRYNRIIEVVGKLRILGAIVLGAIALGIVGMGFFLALAGEAVAADKCQVSGPGVIFETNFWSGKLTCAYVGGMVLNGTSNVDSGEFRSQWCDLENLQKKIDGAAKKREKRKFSNQKRRLERRLTRLQKACSLEWRRALEPDSQYECAAKVLARRCVSDERYSGEEVKNCEIGSIVASGTGQSRKDAYFGGLAACKESLRAEQSYREIDPRYQLDALGECEVVLCSGS